MDLAVDFDGTIVENQFPFIGKEMPGACDTLKKFKDLGCTLILYTCRCGQHLSDALQWLDEHEVRFDYINENTAENLNLYDEDSRKVNADLYIDDKAYGSVIDWEAIGKYVEDRISSVEQRSKHKSIQQSGGSMYIRSDKISFAAGGGVQTEGNLQFKRVSVCKVGEAKGHGFSLSSAFVAKVAELGNAKPGGLKVRYGHPNMCDSSPASIIGRMSNFTVEGDTCYGDLSFIDHAENSPQGNLAASVAALAKDPDLCGMSIVFEPERDEDGILLADPNPDDEDSPFWRIASLHACDLVDDPAATNSMFSANIHSFASQATEFLDSNTKFAEMLRKNPDSVREFLAKYLKQPKDDFNMSKSKLADPSDPEKKPEVQPEQQPKVTPPADGTAAPDPSAPDQQPPAKIEDDPQNKKKKEDGQTADGLSSVLGEIKNLSAQISGLGERLSVLETKVLSGESPVPSSNAASGTARKTLSRFRG